METYDLVDALQAHQGQRHSKSSRQTSETNLIRDKPHYGIFYFSCSSANLKPTGKTLPLEMHLLRDRFRLSAETRH
jgi:hypothetical protein